RHLHFVLSPLPLLRIISLFFFNAPAPSHIYTLSLHDALPISPNGPSRSAIHADEMIMADPVTLEEIVDRLVAEFPERSRHELERDRKSTRLNSSHDQISYAVFCLKKKKKKKKT